MKLLILSTLLCISLFASAQNKDMRTGDSLFSAADWKGAAKFYDRAVHADPTITRGWYRLGVSWQMAKEYDKSVLALKSGLDHPSPVIPPGILNVSLAKTYSLKKDSTKAFEVLKGMINNGYPNFSDLKSADEYASLRSTKTFRQLIEKAESNAYPCKIEAKHLVFDFWVGEWDVYQTGTNFQVGTQRIEKLAGGCLIMENWAASNAPSEGKSMNFIQPSNGKWEQVWMSSNGQYLHYYDGVYDKGIMKYDGQGVDASGNPVQFKLSYHNMGEEKMRQVLERSTDKGTTWSVLYDFSYQRKSK